MRAGACIPRGRPRTAGLINARMAEAEKAKGERRFLIPSTIGEEKATNPSKNAGEPGRSVKMDGAEPVVV